MPDKAIDSEMTDRPIDEKSVPENAMSTSPAKELPEKIRESLVLRSLGHREGDQETFGSLENVQSSVRKLDEKGRGSSSQPM